ATAVLVSTVAAWPRSANAAAPPARTSTTIAAPTIHGQRGRDPSSSRCARSMRNSCSRSWLEWSSLTCRPHARKRRPRKSATAWRATRAGATSSHQALWLTGVMAKPPAEPSPGIPRQCWRQPDAPDTLSRGMTLIRSLRTFAALAADNLRASRGQAAYLIITLAITTAAWLCLAAVGAPYRSSTGSTSFGITIRNGSQNSGELPLHYDNRIEAIRGARDVFWYGIQPVKCSAATMLALYAFGGPGTDKPLLKRKDPPTIVLDTSGPPRNGKPLALHVIGTFPAPFPQGLVHYDYVNRTAPGLQG